MTANSADMVDFKADEKERTKGRKADLAWYKRPGMNSLALAEKVG